MTAFSIDADISGMLGDIDAMEAQIEKAARPAAQAGAEVLYRAVLRNVQSIGKVSGNLERAIYQVYSKRDSVGGVAAYEVSWNFRKAPHGHLLESGFIQKYEVYLGRDGKWYTNKKAPLTTPVQRPAKAFVRRAAAQLPQAIEAMEARLFERIDAR